MTTHVLRSPHDAAIAAALEDERRRLRAWMHDRILQMLEFMAAGGYADEADSSLLRRAAAEAADEVRGFVEDVERPANDLAGALADVAADAQLRAGALEIELVAGAVPADLDPRLVESLASAAREALNNVHRHASAPRATLTFGGDATSVEVSIADDGVGFDVAERPVRAGLRHSIIGRIVQVGGTGRIESRPGCGTRVTLRVPLHRDGS
jgi:signal transduction histidine kinase